MPKQVTVFRSYYDAALMLPEDARAAFMLAIMAFAFDDVEPEFSDPMQAMAWTLIRPNLESSKARSGNGEKGGRPPKKQDEKAPEKASKKATEKAPVKANEKQGVKATGKAIGKDRSKDRIRDKEKEGINFSPLGREKINPTASGSAAADKTAPPAAYDVNDTADYSPPASVLAQTAAHFDAMHGAEDAAAEKQAQTTTELRAAYEAAHPEDAYQPTDPYAEIFEGLD